MLMNNIMVILCILNVEVFSEKDLKGEYLINGWKVFMEGYDEFFINCFVNVINDLVFIVN